MADHDEAFRLIEIVDDTMSAVLRKVCRGYEEASRKLRENAGLVELDPWHLPSHFAMIKESSTSLRTHSGYWKEKEDEFTAIRSQGTESSRSRSPSYRGVKRTLEFYRQDGTKTDWIIHEYQLLDADRRNPDDALRLQEDVVIRKVSFRKGRYRSAPPSHRKYYYLRRFLDCYEEEHAADGECEYNMVGRLKQLKFAATKVQLHLECLKLCEEDLRSGKERSGCGECSTASSARNGTSEVWQYFSKIYTHDPDVVYAACHRCDRVLKAHPKNGTSHLKRHSEKCSSCNNNSSSVNDQEILRELRATLDIYNKEKMEGKLHSEDVNVGLAKLDPWDLQPTPCYITSSLSRETQQGRWEEINNKKNLTAIRIGQLPVPQYGGLKRTLEFYKHDGTKLDWIMVEYHQVQIDVYNAPDLLLEGALMSRKVFQISDDAVSAVRELERRWNADDDDDEECDNGEREEEVKAFMSTLLHDCLLGEGVQAGQARPGKRKRTSAPDGRSEVWLHFTKIYTTDPDRVYAVCHSCDRGYNGHSKNGTSHLRRHNEKCSSKHHEREAEVWPFALIFEILKELENRERAQAGNNEDDLGGCY